MIDPVSIGILTVGTAIQVFGNIKEGNQKAEAAEKDAANQRLQATEVERRASVRADLMGKEGEKLLSSQESYFAKAGVEMSGSPLLVMEQTNKDYHAEIFEMFNESAFRASQLRAGAKFEEESASDIRRSGYFRSLTDVASGAYKTYSIFGDKNPGDKGRLTPEGGLPRVTIYD